MKSPGQLLKEARRRHGVSQKRLAMRAGTTQSAISRIERDRVSPSVDTLGELLYLLGEDLTLAAEERDSGIDRTLNAGNLAISPSQRVQKGLAFADFVRRNRATPPNPTAAMDEPSGIDVPLDADALLRSLSRHGVDFVLIGGMAGLIHGSAYPTYDLDIAYSRDGANPARLASALEEIGVTLRGAPSNLPFTPDAATLEAGANFTFDTAHGSFDILGHVPGISDYHDLRREANIEEIDGIDVRVASIDHLIAMKRAANRTKDKLMVEEYIVLADEQRLAGAADD